MSEPAPTYTPALSPRQPATDPHLADLLELRAIAQGTEAEAYTWPRLARRLNEMIRFREGELHWQQERIAGAQVCDFGAEEYPAGVPVGAPTVHSGAPTYQE